MRRLCSMGVNCLSGVKAGGIALALALSAPALAAEDSRQSLQWFVMDYPPAYIVTGPGAGTGYQDQVLDYFAAALPGFDIERQSASLARVLSNLEHGTASCAGAMGRTPERERYLVFSKPVIHSLPIRLVVRADAAASIRPYLDAEGEVDLPGLIGAELQAGLVKGRTYGGPVDEFAEGLVERGQASVAAKPDLVFRMLARGRFDYSFAYPDEAGYYARLLKEGDDAAGFETFPIAGFTDITASHFACTNDAAGQRFIEAADKVIGRFGSLSPWMTYYLDWIDGNARRDLEAVLHARR